MNIQQQGQLDSEPGRDRCPLCGGPAGRWVNPAVWEREDMRRALAVRDMQGVYRLLQRYGVSQRAIATRTGQSQSEVSDILGGRKVLSYDLLVRIAEGLGVPRGSPGIRPVS